MKSTIIGCATLLMCVGCDTPTASESFSVPGVLAQRSSSAPVHSLTGGGQVDVSNFDPSLPPESYAFAASVDGEGVVRGMVQIDLSDPDVTFHANVTCRAVDGTSAWIGGVVSETSDATKLALNTPFWARVQDGGEGVSANPDAISFLRLGAPASVCNQKRPAGMPFVFFRGNIQVR